MPAVIRYHSKGRHRRLVTLLATLDMLSALRFSLALGKRIKSPFFNNKYLLIVTYLFVCVFVMCVIILFIRSPTFSSLSLGKLPPQEANRSNFTSFIYLYV